MNRPTKSRHGPYRKYVESQNQNILLESLDAHPPEYLGPTKHTSLKSESILSKKSAATKAEDINQ